MFTRVAVIAVSVTSGARVCVRRRELVRSRLCAHMPPYVFVIQETGTHHSIGSRGIRRCSATFISVRKETEQTYVAVCSALHKIRGRETEGGGKGFDCRGNGCLTLNEKSAVEKIQRGNFTPAYEQGSE